MRPLERNRKCFLLKVLDWGIVSAGSIVAHRFPGQGVNLHTDFAKHLEKVFHSFATPDPHPEILPPQDP